MKASKLTGMPVISIADGEKAGQISDLMFTATAPQVDALVLKTDREPTILPFDAIRRVGPDAIMIDTLDDVRTEVSSDSGEDIRRYTTLLGKETAGDDGSYLGDVKDLDIDTGRIEVIFLHRGGILGIGGEHIMIPGTGLHAIGPKLLTVSPPVVCDASESAEDRADQTMRTASGNL